jgi:hypothetical protein
MKERKNRFCLRLSVIQKEYDRRGWRLRHVSWGRESATLPRSVLLRGLLTVLNAKLRGKRERSYLTRQWLEEDRLMSMASSVTNQKHRESRRKYRERAKKAVQFAFAPCSSGI